MQAWPDQSPKDLWVGSLRHSPIQDTAWVGDNIPVTGNLGLLLKGVPGTAQTMLQAFPGNPCTGGHPVTTHHLWGLNGTAATSASVATLCLLSLGSTVTCLPQAPHSPHLSAWYHVDPGKRGQPTAS